MSKMNTRKTKNKKQICYGKKSGCLYKGKPWDSHPDNPANSAKSVASSLSKAGLLAHAKGLKQGGYTSEATKMMRAYMKKYGNK